MASTRNSNIIKKLGRSSDGRINQDCHCCMHEIGRHGKIIKYMT